MNTNTRRIRKRPSDFALPLPSLLPTTKRYYNKTKKIKWELDLDLDLDISNSDERILEQIALKIEEACPTDLSCFDINKNIAEYAFGILKKCPCCINDEILIIQSLFNKLTEPIECNRCNEQLFLHICDDCSKNYYYECGWWMSLQPISETQAFPIPELNTCKDCAFEILTFNKLHGTLNETIICPEICGECKFECDLCGYIFCIAKHLKYNCDKCNYAYCSDCYSLFSNNNKLCPNCCSKNQLFKHIGYENTNYTNIRQRLLFLEYLGGRGFDTIDKILLLKITPEIIQYIAAYSVGFVHYCDVNGCNEAIYVENTPLEIEKNIIPVKQLLKCSQGHLNYYHLCTECNTPFVINSFSPFKYLMYAQAILPIGNHVNSLLWYRDYTTVNERNEIESGICNMCRGKIIVLHNKNNHKIHHACAQCIGICSRCNNLMCKNHMSHCLDCDHSYCSQCQSFDPDVEFLECISCGSMKCASCRAFPDICNACYSPYIDKYCSSENEYMHCVGIAKDIFDAWTPFSYLELHNIINIIAVYAM